MLSKFQGTNLWWRLQIEQWTLQKLWIYSMRDATQSHQKIILLVIHWVQSRNQWMLLKLQHRLIWWTRMRTNMLYNSSDCETLKRDKNCKTNLTQLSVVLVQRIIIWVMNSRVILWCFSSIIKVTGRKLWIKLIPTWPNLINNSKEEPASLKNKHKPTMQSMKIKDL